MANLLVGRGKKIPQQVMAKAPGLFPMLYTVAELAAELSIPDSTLRGWFSVGAPFIRDEKNHIWIDGAAFQQWLSTQRETRKKEPLADHQAWCLHCKKPVALLNPVTLPVQGKLIFIRGVCPECGSIINRGGRRD